MVKFRKIRKKRLIVLYAMIFIVIALTSCCNPPWSLATLDRSSRLGAAIKDFNIHFITYGVTGKHEVYQRLVTNDSVTVSGIDFIVRNKKVKMKKLQIREDYIWLNRDFPVRDTVHIIYCEFNKRIHDGDTVVFKEYINAGQPDTITSKFVFSEGRGIPVRLPTWLTQEENWAKRLGNVY